MMEFKKADELAFDPRPQMAKIFADGFYDDGLRFICKDKAKWANAMAPAFCLDAFYVAVEGDQVLSMVGIVEKKPPPIALDKKVLRQALGFLRGTIAYYGLKKFIVDKPYPFVQPPNSGSIEFVATALHHQGKGAAFRLINYVMDATPYRNYVLEVVAGNAAAIHLYEKLGFAEFMRVPAPKRSGLGHFIYMKKAG